MRKTGWLGVKLVLFATLCSVLPVSDQSILLVQAPTISVAYAQQNSADLSNEAINFKFDTTTALPGSFGSKAGSGGNTLNDVAGRIISLMLQLMATVGIIVCIFGAVNMVTAEGDSGKLKKGQQAFMNGVLGTIFVLISYLVVAFVRDFILKING